MSNAEFNPAQPHKQASEKPAAANPFCETEVEKVASIYEAELAHDEFFAHFAPTMEVAAEPVFHVPKRFGVSGILGITTVMAILFSILRSTDAPVLFYWFFGLLSLMICLAQMHFGDVPRQASTIAGAILMPVFTVVTILFDIEPLRSEEHLVAIVAGIFFGALLGYLTGTCLGGVFLLTDMLENFWTRPAGQVQKGQADGPTAP